MLMLRIFVTGCLKYQVPKLIPTVRFFHLKLFGEVSGIFSLNFYMINFWKTYSKSVLVSITELRITIVLLIMTVY